MSITAETAKAHAHDPAVLCCRAEGGITIEPANLEDPAIFDDLGRSDLYLYFKDSGKLLKAPPKYRVDVNEPLLAALERLLGKENCQFVGEW